MPLGRNRDRPPSRRRKGPKQVRRGRGFLSPGLVERAWSVHDRLPIQRKVGGSVGSARCESQRPEPADESVAERRP